MKFVALILAVFLCLAITRSYLTVRPDFRSDDIPIAEINPEGPAIKVTVLGTSLTANYVWPRQLQNIFPQCTDRDVTVQVVAMPGATSGWGVEQLEQVVQSGPDVVLIEFAVNDANIRRAVLPFHSRTNHQHILDGLAKALPRAKVVLMSMNPVTGARSVLRPTIGRYYGLYPELAERNGVGFVNITRRWAARPALPEALADGLHPKQDAASEVISQVLRDYFAVTGCGGN